MRRKSLFSAALALVFLLTQPLGALAAEPDQETPPAESPIQAPETPEQPETPAELPEQPVLDPETPEQPAEPAEQPPEQPESPIETPEQPAEPPENPAEQPEPPAETPEQPETPAETPEAPAPSELPEQPEPSEQPEPAADVEVSQGGQLIFNPYGFPVELAGETSCRQIVSTKESLTNRSESPVIVRARAVASAPEEFQISFAESPLDPEAQGKLVFLYVEFQPAADEPAWQPDFSFAENQLPAASDEGEKRQIIVLEPGQSLEYRVFGQAGCNPLPDQPWTGEEWVDLSVQFDFEPVEPETPETPADPTPDQPETPETPADPTPDQPETPETPADPTPDQPETPETPADPTPDQPETPETPADPTPDQPETPETPADPTPGQPEDPVEPAEPEDPAPETPAEPQEPEVIPPDGEQPDPAQPPEESAEII